MQRTQITFPSDKASLPRRTRHNNVSPASRAILSQSSLFHVRSTFELRANIPLSAFSPHRGEEEGINISRELITALGRYKVYPRRGGIAKSIA